MNAKAITAITLGCASVVVLAVAGVQGWQLPPMVSTVLGSLAAGALAYLIPSPIDRPATIQVAAVATNPKTEASTIREDLP